MSCSDGHSPAVDTDHYYTRYVETYTTRNDGICGRQVQGARFVLDAVDDERGVRFVPLVPVEIERDWHERDQCRQQPDDDNRSDGDPPRYPAAVSARTGEKMKKNRKLKTYANEKKVIINWG